MSISLRNRVLARILSLVLVAFVSGIAAATYLVQPRVAELQQEVAGSQKMVAYYQKILSSHACLHAPDQRAPVEESDRLAI